MTDVTLNAPLPASFRDRMDRMRSRVQPGAKVLEVDLSARLEALADKTAEDFGGADLSVAPRVEAKVQRD